MTRGKKSYATGTSIIAECKIEKDVKFAKENFYAQGKKSASKTYAIVDL